MLSRGKESADDFRNKISFQPGGEKGKKREAKKDQFQALAPSYTCLGMQKGGKREKEKEKAIDSRVTPP